MALDSTGAVSSSTPRAIAKDAYLYAPWNRPRYFHDRRAHGLMRTPNRTSPELLRSL